MAKTFVGGGALFLVLQYKAVATQLPILPLKLEPKRRPSLKYGKWAPLTGGACDITTGL